jgi:hypothetical protein
MFTPAEVLGGVLLPVGVALLICLLAALLRREAAGRIGSALGIGLGLLSAYVALPGQVDLSRFPPADSTQWIFYGVALVTGLAIADATVRSPTWLRGLVYALTVAGLTVPILLAPGLAHWPAGTVGLWIGVLAIATVLTWLAADRAACVLPGALVPGVLAAMACGSAVSMTLSGTLRLGQITLALAAVSAMVGVVGLFARRLTVNRGGAAVVIVPLALLLAASRLFAGLHMLDGVLLLSAACFLWLGSLTTPRRPVLRVWLAILLPLLPIFAATGLVVGRFVSVQAANSGDMYY